MSWPFALKRWLLGLALLLPAGSAIGHPIPTVPVRAYFEQGGEARIEIEIDPRFFAADPIGAPYVFKSDLDGMEEGARTSLQREAEAFAVRSVAFYFEPVGRFVPEFQFQFTGQGGVELESDDDPVMLLGSSTTRLAAGLTGYRVQALLAVGASVVVTHSVDGRQLKRVHVLFPGESSYVLDLTGMTGSRPAAPAGVATREGDGTGVTFISFLRQGFVHVLPLGLDHILFVLGLFFLSREWRPLLWQVTMFTFAHTLTLALATLGYVSLPGSIVEPVIAASIAVVAIENIFHAKYTRWRLLIVFVFGLVHGLGFAGALQDLNLPAASLFVGLFGFNLGVEFGQLAVVALAFAATFWLRQDRVYRKTMAVPASLAIALIGAWWTVERLFLP